MKDEAKVEWNRSPLKRNVGWHYRIKRIVRLKRILFLVFLFAPTADSPAQRKELPKFPSFIYGTWRIERVEEVAGHVFQTHEMAKEQIGREIQFKHAAIVYEKGTLYFESKCSGLRYTFKRRKRGEYDIGEKGTLDFYDRGPARQGWIQHLIVRCRGGAAYAFELAQDKQLAVYYDGWFFFLKKVSA